MTDTVNTVTTENQATSHKLRPERLAYLNGVKTTAKKYGKRWLVGGDFPQKGDRVLIAAWKKDEENGGGYWAWFSLRGAFLRFQDLMTDSQKEEQAAIAKAEGK